MLDPDIKVVHTTEQRQYDAQLQAIVSLRVEFMVGRFGPFVEKFPKDGFTAEQRDVALNAFAAQVRG